MVDKEAFIKACKDCGGDVKDMGDKVMCNINDKVEVELEGNLVKVNNKVPLKYIVESESGDKEAAYMLMKNFMKEIKQASD